LPKSDYLSATKSEQLKPACDQFVTNKQMHCQMEIQSEIATRNIDQAEPTKREAQNNGETLHLKSTSEQLHHET
jgi:hypothetical protein